MGAGTFPGAAGGAPMSVRREITLTRRRLLDTRAVIDALLAHADGTGKPGWDVLEEIMRRAEFVVADGYPTQSMADSDIHGGFAQTGDTSTERAALRLASESDEEALAHFRQVQADVWRERERDVAGDALVELRSDVEHMAQLADNVDNCRKLVLSIQGRKRGRESTVDNCPLCGGLVTNVGEDRIKAGYCPACYTAWRRAGSPRDSVERHQFERARLEALKLEQREPDRHVACEHICCPVDMRKSPSHEHFHPPASCPSCAEVSKAC